MTTQTLAPGHLVDGATAADLRLSYSQVKGIGIDSVRMSWRFGQNIDSHRDTYTMKQLAECMDLSVGTLHRYLALYQAYQRPELAVEASQQLQTYDIGIISGLKDQRPPGQGLAGRRFRYQCRHCHSTDITRLELNEDGQPLEPLEDLGRKTVP